MSRRISFTMRAALAALAACLMAGLTVVPAVGAGKPNLVVAAVSNPPSAEVAGGTFKVTDTVANKGSGTAPASKTAYFLSANTSFGGDVKLQGSRRVGKLRPGTKSRGTATVTVPQSIKPGSYHVIVCADAARAVSETSDKDNCRASGKKVSFLKAPQGYDPTPFGEPEPVSTTPTLASEGAVTEKISARLGGTITTSAPDGSTFTLTIPAQALLSDEKISMTPLSAVSGDPLGLQLAAGVQLQPEGLQFVKPVTLTIDPATPVPAAEETSIVADADGSDLHLYPVESDPTTYTFHLMHFTIAAVAHATPEARAEQMARIPAHHEAARAQELAGVDAAAKSGDMSAEEAAERMRTLYRQVFDSTIRPRMFQAMTDWRVFVEAAIAWRSWEREVQLRGFNDIISQAQESEMQAMYSEAFATFVKEFHRRCVEDRDLGAAQVLLALERRRQLEGGSDESAMIMDRIERCATFELEFDSRFEQTLNGYFGGSGTKDLHVNATVKFSISPLPAENGHDVGAEGPLTYKEAQGHLTSSNFGTCTYDITGTIPDLFTVLKVDLDYNFKKQADDRYTVDPVLTSLTFDTGTPKEIERWACQWDGGGDSGTEETTHWQNAWSDHHNAVNQDDCYLWDDDADQPPQRGEVCKFWDWTPGPAGSGIVAQKSISHHLMAEWDGTLESQEETRLYLRHTPQP